MPKSSRRPSKGQRHSSQKRRPARRAAAPASHTPAAAQSQPPRQTEHRAPADEARSQAAAGQPTRRATPAAVTPHDPLLPKELRRIGILTAGVVVLLAVLTVLFR